MSEGVARDSDDERECNEDPDDELVDSVRSVSLRLMAAISFKCIIESSSEKLEVRWKWSSKDRNNQDLLDSKFYRGKPACMVAK